eukprot:66189-Hanusia_phi.AAC.2
MILSKIEQQCSDISTCLSILEEIVRVCISSEIVRMGQGYFGESFQSFLLVRRMQLAIPESSRSKL